MIFEFDHYIDGRPCPNLARHQAKPFTPEWRKFSQHWPYSEPPSLIEYFNDEGIDWRSQGTRCYLVAVSFFDFSIDWFSIIPTHRINELQRGELKLVFFYSEGDNPQRMRDHLLAQCQKNNVDQSSLWLISANSSADLLPHSAWFADDELLYRKRNRLVVPCEYNELVRDRQFTALVRTHKWWRATIMADFWRRGWDQLGYFAYNSSISVGDKEDENPIEVDQFEGLRKITHEFLKNQFTADGQTSDEHNDHHLWVPEHYKDAYLNIVIETHMDVDQSGGVFLTEKTFKPIKHAQPFVIFGAAHSLARLRDLGYRTFDRVIDNHYDTIENTTERYAALMSVLEDIIDNNRMPELYQKCERDLIHNQQHFLASKQDRLNTLLGKITCE